jgi:hypothetical protein
MGAGVARKLRLRRASRVAAAFVAVVGAGSLAASPASATVVKWTCDVAPNSWCILDDPHHYYSQDVQTDATFEVATGVLFKELNGTQYAWAYGNINANDNGWVGLPINLGDIPTGWNFDPGVFNEDPTNYRNFTIYSDY